MKIVSEEALGLVKQNMINVETDLDEFYDKTPHRLLDIFPKSLTVKECETVSFAYEDWHLRNEYKYKPLFEKLYKENQEKGIIVNFYYKDMEIQTHKNILSGLDRLRAYEWLTFIVKTDIDKTTDFFFVESLEDLKMIMEINMREIMFSIVHYLETGIAIRGGFDMSMEVFFQSEQQILELSDKVREYDLFVRPYPNR